MACFSCEETFAVLLRILTSAISVFIHRYRDDYAIKVLISRVKVNNSGVAPRYNYLYVANV